MTSYSHSTAPQYQASPAATHPQLATLQATGKAPPSFGPTAQRLAQPQIQLASTQSVARAVRMSSVDGPIRPQFATPIVPPRFQANGHLPNSQAPASVGHAYNHNVTSQQHQYATSQQNMSVTSSQQQQHQQQLNGNISNDTRTDQAPALRPRPAHQMTSAHDTVTPASLADASGSTWTPSKAELLQEQQNRMALLYRDMNRKTCL